jgi:hypothetical protein
VTVAAAQGRIGTDQNNLSTDQISFDVDRAAI